MANSSISISSDALVLLGHQPISSFVDADAGSLLAAQLYTTTYHAMLTETLWHFATRTAKLAKHSQVPEFSAFKNRFQLPVDCLYLVKTNTEYYEVYERDVYTNTEELEIEYIYPVEEVNLPPSFVKALEFSLAALFAIPLTGNATRADYYAKLAQNQLAKARRADASSRPASQMGRDRYMEVRYS